MGPGIDRLWPGQSPPETVRPQPRSDTLRTATRWDGLVCAVTRESQRPATWPPPHTAGWGEPPRPLTDRCPQEPELRKAGGDFQLSTVVAPEGTLLPRAEWSGARSRHSPGSSQPVPGRRPQPMREPSAALSSAAERPDASH